ncbi:MAG: WYL domain-containing protein [Campylobacterota bacterium]|nr:WYL domain-containing protein [Campylobacterota bacterium]
MQDYHNRLERLDYILIELSKGARLSTPMLVEQLNVTKKIIQTDFKEYILPYVEEVYYDYSAKCYIAKSNFLQNMLLESSTLATMLMLKAKSRDKYSPDGFAQSVDSFFAEHENLLEERIYSQSMVEKLDGSNDERIFIENAIKSKNVIRCSYNEKARELYPLKILNLEGFWYLINWDTEYDDIRRYHLKSIKDIEVLDETFEKSSVMDEILERFDNAINAFFEPFAEPFAVELFLDAKVAKYFLRMPISKSQRVMKTYEDGSMDLEFYITDYMEIIPIIQRYMPYVGVIEPEGLRDVVEENMKAYGERFL